MSNKIGNIKSMGVNVAANVEHVEHSGGQAYMYRPAGEAPRAMRDTGKQSLIVAAALRDTGVSLYGISAIDSGVCSLSGSKSYLGKGFAGAKGYGVYWRVLSASDYLAQFDDDDTREAERRALPKSVQDAPETVGLVIMHAWHDQAKLGRSPRAGDYKADSTARALLGIESPKGKPRKSKAKAKASETQADAQLKANIESDSVAGEAVSETQADNS